LSIRPLLFAVAVAFAFAVALAFALFFSCHPSPQAEDLLFVSSATTTTKPLIAHKTSAQLMVHRRVNRKMEHQVPPEAEDS
jgi:hypothetical protein